MFNVVLARILHIMYYMQIDHYVFIMNGTYIIGDLMGFTIVAILTWPYISIEF